MWGVCRLVRCGCGFGLSSCLIVKIFVVLFVLFWGILCSVMNCFECVGMFFSLECVVFPVIFFFFEAGLCCLFGYLLGVEICFFNVGFCMYKSCLSWYLCSFFFCCCERVIFSFRFVMVSSIH